jgi:hypothetical protein
VEGRARRSTDDRPLTDNPWNRISFTDFDSLTFKIVRAISTRALGSLCDAN